MNSTIKRWIKRFRYLWNIFATGFILFLLIHIFVKGKILLAESNTAWLVIECILVGVTLILQFIPIKD